MHQTLAQANMRLMVFARSAEAVSGSSSSIRWRCAVAIGKLHAYTAACLFAHVKVCYRQMTYVKDSQVTTLSLPCSFKVVGATPLLSGTTFIQKLGT